MGHRKTFIDVTLVFMAKLMKAVKIRYSLIGRVFISLLSASEMILFLFVSAVKISLQNSIHLKVTLWWPKLTAWGTICHFPTWSVIPITHASVIADSPAIIGDFEFCLQTWQVIIVTFSWAGQEITHGRQIDKLATLDVVLVVSVWTELSDINLSHSRLGL
jgi:uncharacterized membrane protein (DUF106 family)